MQFNHKMKFSYMFSKLFYKEFVKLIIEADGN